MDLVVARAPIGDVVGVIGGDNHPKPPLLVPVHGDRLTGKVLLAGKEFHLPSLRCDEVLRGLFRREGFLHFRLRLPLGSPASTRGVVGDLRADIDIFEGSDIGSLLGHRSRHEVLGVAWECWKCIKGFFTHCPANPSFDEFMKTWVRPGSLIMPPRGVEDSAFPLRANPSPRLLLLVVGLNSLNTVLQDRSVLGVVAMMNIGLVPTDESVKRRHDGMDGLGNNGGESSRLVRLELRADQVDILWRIEEAVRRAVERDQAATPFDIVDQRFFLLGGDRFDVRVDDQAPVGIESGRRQAVDVTGVLDLNPSLGKDGDQLLGTGGWLMMAVIPQKKETNRLLGSCGRQGHH